jgi:hypothetical protein
MIDKVVVVTAEGSGMGAAAARKLGGGGFKVAVRDHGGCDAVFCGGRLPGLGDQIPTTSAVGRVRHGLAARIAGGVAGGVRGELEDGHAARKLVRCCATGTGQAAATRQSTVRSKPDREVPQPTHCRRSPHVVSSHSQPVDSAVTKRASLDAPTGRPSARPFTVPWLAGPSPDRRERRTIAVCVSCLEVRAPPGR